MIYIMSFHCDTKIPARFTRNKWMFFGDSFHFR